MFQRICDYALMRRAGQWFRPRAYGAPRPDGRWDGWLIFFPLLGAPAIAADRETTQSTLARLTQWSTGLTPVYIEGALERALRLAEQPSLINSLARAEYDALADVEQLAATAEIQRTLAEAEEAAAVLARADAEKLRRERAIAERVLAERDEAIATTQAVLHEDAARSARSDAARAAKRRSSAEAEAKRSASVRTVKSAKRRASTPRKPRQKGRRKKM